MHVHAPEIRSLPWWLRWLLRRQQRRFGATLLPARVWARVPALYAALAGFYAALERRRSPLEPALRSLVQIRVSQVNACDFCIDLNAALAAERSGTLDQALVVERWRDSNTPFSQRERLALEYAEVMTTTGAAAGPLLIERLRETFGEQGLIELTALIAFQNLSSKFNAALDIPSQGFCRMGDAPPSPAQAATARGSSSPAVPPPATASHTKPV